MNARVTRRRYAVAQLGARMHYAVARILEADGSLVRFYTDLTAPRSSRLLSVLSRFNQSAARLRGRNAGLPNGKIQSFGAFGLEYGLRLRLAHRTGQSLKAFLWAGKRFGENVLRHWDSTANAVYTFNSAGLEILRHAKANGCSSVTEQTIAPMRFESHIMEEETAAWPGWELGSVSKSLAEAYAEREEQEWIEAGQVICGSSFVADCIGASGSHKCTVVPYGVDPAQYDVRSCPVGRSDPTTLRVLFVGTVGLRKGVPYLHEAAGLSSRRCEFRVVGPVSISSTAARTMQGRLQFVGPIPRTSIWEQYCWADVLVLPSLCEGSATVSYEALAAGIPVIATPNAGTVVRDGLEGFIIPPRSPEAIASRLDLLLSSPDLLRHLSVNARLRASEFNVAEYASRLLAVLQPA